MNDVMLVGLDHRGASVAALESAQARSRGRSAPAGAVALVTCHRTELYLEAPSTAAAVAAFNAWLELDGAAAVAALPRLRVALGEAAAEHLLRVAAGLESAVLGEDQVLGQVREAYAAACATGRPGPLLHRLFHAAFRCGRRVRAETGIGGGVRSLAGAAVCFLDAELGGLAGRTVLVLGAGEMGELVATRLGERGVGRLLVCNRTAARAHRLAARVGGVAVRWEWRRAAIAETDAVVCATGARTIVVPGSWIDSAARGGRRLVAVDLAMPRNVEPSSDAVLADVARLGALLEDDRARRHAAVRNAEAVVRQEVVEWVGWAAARRQGVVGVERRRARAVV